MLGHAVPRCSFRPKFSTWVLMHYCTQFSCLEETRWFRWSAHYQAVHDHNNTFLGFCWTFGVQNQSSGSCTSAFALIYGVISFCQQRAVCPQFRSSSTGHKYISFPCLSQDKHTMLVYCNDLHCHTEEHDISAVTGFSWCPTVPSGLLIRELNLHLDSLKAAVKLILKAVDT